MLPCMKLPRSRPKLGAGKSCSMPRNKCKKPSGGCVALQYPMEMLQICVEIHRLENEGDALLRKAMARLFKERSSDPIYVIKWKELYELLGVATDACEDVANIIEGVVLEHA